MSLPYRLNPFAVIVALLAVIAIAKGTDVLEQMPDVQRAWLTWPPSLGWAHLAFAVLAQVLLAILLILLGVLRTQHAREPGDGRDAYSWLPWLLIAVAVPAIALIVRFTGIATVSWYNVIPIPALAALVVIASWLYEKMPARRQEASATITTATTGDRGPTAEPPAMPSDIGASDATQERYGPGPSRSARPGRSWSRTCTHPTADPAAPTTAPSSPTATSTAPPRPRRCWNSARWPATPPRTRPPPMTCRQPRPPATSSVR